MTTGKELISHARAFSMMAHDGVIRKYTGEPYVNHSIEVAEIVSNYTNDPHVITAALLHDVVEDTNVTIDNIKSIFGERVAILVDSVTNWSKKSDGNRSIRMDIYNRHLSNACDDGALIKLADILSNTRDIDKYDIPFAKIYINEKLITLEHLNNKTCSLYKTVKTHLENKKNILKNL